jgi:glycosyltransferase involved in cell wall biosynthesis
VDRVSLAYVNHFHNRSRAVLRIGPLWLTFTFPASQHLFAELLLATRHGWAWGFWLLSLASRTRVGLPRHGEFFFNTGHSGLEHPRYAHRVKNAGVRPLYFVHDLIPLTHPEYSRPGEEARHRQRVATFLKTASGLIVNSDDTRQVLRDYAVQHRMELANCIVAPLAPAVLPPAAARRPMVDPYFVVLGTIEPRKNHLLLLNLWRALTEQMGIETPRLVVIGRRGWECEQVVDLLERCATLRGVVHELPRCSDAELATWLHHSQALLFPSFVEGFGMPLVEALSAGVPVLASNLPVFREVAGLVPEYFDPLDGAAWREAILDYAVPGSARRQEQLARFADYLPPTWERHFKQVDAMMERLDAPT